MAVKEIKQHPDKVLTTPAREVHLKMASGNAHPSVKESWVKWIESTVQNLIDTMVEHDGLGLAAPQIGMPFKIIVFRDGTDIRYLINPVIIASSNVAQSIDEGCLSIKGKLVNIRRSKHITVKGYTLSGGQLVQTVVRSRNKTLSFELQHEIDHINGRTILDRGK